MYSNLVRDTYGAIFLCSQEDGQGHPKFANNISNQIVISENVKILFSNLMSQRSTLLLTELIIEDLGGDRLEEHKRVRLDHREIHLKFR